MSYVLRTRTIVERADVDTKALSKKSPGDGRFALLVGTALNKKWDPISDSVVYEVHDEGAHGCTVAQLAEEAL